MNLAAMLRRRQDAGEPVRVGVIGAGKFSAMFFAQALHTPGLHVLAVADLSPDRAQATFRRVGWPEERYAASGFEDARASGATFVTDDAEALIEAPGIDVVVEATGHPAAGIKHCLRAIQAGRHVVMVNVEADVLAGPLLARKAQAAGVVYSLAYGDQPALICEHVDWARACGFEVVCAGKGTRYLPAFHASTPETVWENLNITREVAERAGNNPQMFNSFVDGTKSGIEMAAVCNATGLTPQPGGLKFPPSPARGLAEACKPQVDGGTLAHAGTTEVVSSLNRDGSPVQDDLQMGTYVVVEAASDFVRHCAQEYRMLHDSGGRYLALYRPIHLIGLELGVSVASAALRGEPTGAPAAFVADVVATAKRDLKAGEVLDGEGGYRVWGKQTPAKDSLEAGALPLGLAQNVKLKNAIAEGQPVRWQDVEIDENAQAVRVRREMEATCLG